MMQVFFDEDRKEFFSFDFFDFDKSVDDYFKPDYDW